VAGDRDPKAIAATTRNAQAAGISTALVAVVREVRDLELPGEGAMIVSNPPYGERLGNPRELSTLYRELGDVLKRRGAGATAWLLVGNPALVKAVGLRASRRIVLFNGPIECRLLRYDLYQGERSKSPDERTVPR
jgi:putative N6-adenine-specific DNA methylase